MPFAAGPRFSRPAPMVARAVPPISPLLMGRRSSHVPAATVMGVTDTSR